MIKILLRLFSTILVFAPLLAYNPVVIDEDSTSTYFSLSSPTYGPYFKYEESSKLSIIVTPNVNGTYHECFKQGHLNALNHTQSKAPHSVKNKVQYSIDFDLMTNMFLGDTGMSCCLAFYSSSGTVKQKFEFTIMPETVKMTDVDLNKTDQRIFSTIGSRFKFNKSNVSYINETISFVNLTEDFETDQYYRLFISNFYFKFIPSNNFTYKEAFLSIERNVLPNADFPIIGNAICIPLKIEIKNLNANIYFKDTMFVNPQTLDMSKEAKEGYLSTKYFYLPRNQKDVIKNMEIKFNIIGLGINETNFYYTSKYSTNKNLIGPCHLSEYCVIGEIG